MFYVKANLSPNVALITEVHNYPVYTRCPNCGEELQIDLNHLIYDDQIDLDESACYYLRCFYKRLKEAHR